MNNKIIVAPLNWGLGHATRCVPIIRFLLVNNYTPILASDGISLKFLQKEFSDLESFELPSYNISYSKNLKWSLLFQTPKILKAIRKEKQLIANFLSKRDDVIGIISDNRFGVRHHTVPSVYITHQLNVLSGFATFLSSAIHQNYINKFDECWVPDTKEHTFSGKLSRVKKLSIPVKFIGVLSRFQKNELPKKNDVLIILSGIESQRKQLEESLIEKFKNTSKKVVLVQGIIQDKPKRTTIKGIKVYNYLLSDVLEKEINQSEVIICRSGYSSIMDLAVLHKKAFFIPTKNQSEQEYLAKHLQSEKIAPFSIAKDFTKEHLNIVDKYKGLKVSNTNLSKDLLGLFQGK
jgi:uncharacterized protein (TIGR00661 family)